MSRSAGAALLALAVTITAGAQGNRGGYGSGTVYVGTYAKRILVLDEATLKVRDTIPVSIGIPLGVGLSDDKKRFYVLDPRQETVEVIDIATKKSLHTITLSDGPKRVQLSGLNVDPQERFAVFLVRTSQKKSDRWEIGKPTLLKYDLKKKAVTDTIPWPKGEERDFAQLMFTPDGNLMYFFGTTEVLVFDTQTLKQVDRWELGRSLDDGMGRFNFGFPDDAYEERGFSTGLFRVTDPVQHRTMMGVARVDLVKRSVDFYTLGPSEPVTFQLAPGKQRAYGLKRSVGNYEFWTFDLASRRVVGKTPFAGRPRMGMNVSSNGKYLYIHTAGPTIDVYDASTFAKVRSVDIGEDMTDFVLIPSQPAAAATRGR